jgi:hypothetical protein
MANFAELFSRGSRPKRLNGQAPRKDRGVRGICELSGLASGAAEGVEVSQSHWQSQIINPGLRRAHAHYDALLCGSDGHTAKCSFERQAINRSVSAPVSRSTIVRAAQVAGSYRRLASLAARPEKREYSHQFGSHRIPVQTGAEKSAFTAIGKKKEAICSNQHRTNRNFSCSV